MLDGPREEAEPRSSTTADIGKAPKPSGPPLQDSDIPF